MRPAVVGLASERTAGVSVDLRVQARAPVASPPRDPRRKWSQCSQWPWLLFRHRVREPRRAAPGSSPAPLLADRPRRPCAAPTGRRSGAGRAGRAATSAAGRSAGASPRPVRLPATPARCGRAVEGDGGKAPDSELVLRVPRRGERGRAGPQPIGRARGKARGGAGEMDRPCLGEVDQQHTLPLGIPAREALAAVLQHDAVERHGLVGCRQQVGRPDLASLVRRHQGKARAAFFVRRLADCLGLPPFCFQVVVFFGRQFSWLASRRDPCSFAS